MPKAIVLPFPPVRRLAFIRRQAEYIGTLSPAAGRRHLRRQLEIQAAAFERKGVSQNRIEGEMLALDRAIRTVLTRSGEACGDVA